MSANRKAPERAGASSIRLGSGSILGVNRSAAAEPVIHAETRNMVGEFPLERGGHAAHGGDDLVLAEIDVEVFELGAPVAGDGELNAAAGGPARLYVLEARARERGVHEIHRIVGLHLAISGAGGAVYQRARRDQVADTAARRAEP